MNKFGNFNDEDMIKYLGNKTFCLTDDGNPRDIQIKLDSKMYRHTTRVILNRALDAHLVQRVIDEPKSSDKSVKIEDKYTLKKLPDGKIWMMENLREFVEGAEWSDEYNCYYYTWDQAKMAVPEGFHLPSMSEFAFLCESLGYGKVPDKEVAKKLREECGFALSGFFELDEFCGQGSRAYYWSSTQAGEDTAHTLYFEASGRVSSGYYYTKYFGRPVRCIKDMK